GSDPRHLLAGLGPLADPAIAEVAARLAEIAPARRRELTVEHFIPALATSLVDTALQAMTVELHLARLRGALAGPSAAERFNSFLELISAPGAMLELLGLYPVLARQLVERVGQWRASTIELIDRIVADGVTLDHRFG